MDEITIQIKLRPWRLVVARLWVWLCVLSEKTLPGSVDPDFEAKRVAEFVLRGVRAEVKK